MSEAARPRVSVLMSVYNGQAYLRESIDSVLAQRPGDFELLIFDDASTDRSADIVESYKDDRIVFVKNPLNKGLFANLNELVRRSRGGLIKLWSQDDVMLPGCLQKGLEFSRIHPQVGCFYAACESIGPSGECEGTAKEDHTPTVLPPAEADLYTFLHGCLSSNISNLFFLREAFDSAGMFDEGCIAGDLDMMVRVQARYPIGRIPEVLLRVRNHAGQWSRSKNAALSFMEHEMRISRYLKERVVERGPMTKQTADRVQAEKYARNYFHAAVRSALSGRLGYATKILRLLAREIPLCVLAGLWLRGLPGRVAKASR